MRKQAFSAFSCDHFTQAVKTGSANIGDAAKFAEKALRRFRADTGNLQKLGRGLAFGAALTMECDCESVSFIANLLDEMEDGRMTVQNDRFVFLTVNVKDFLFFCDACERLIDDLQ